MSARVDYLKIAPQAMAILFEQEAHISQQFSHQESLSKEMLTLVKIRVSQINQCAFCVDLHHKEAQIAHVSQERLYGLVTWREMACYSEQEKKALHWAELLTENKHINYDEVVKAVAILSERGLVELTVAVNAINSWNRISRAFKPPVGSLDAVMFS